MSSGLMYELSAGVRLPAVFLGLPIAIFTILERNSWLRQNVHRSAAVAV